jgi:hypothetical protein
MGNIQNIIYKYGEFNQVEIGFGSVLIAGLMELAIILTLYILRAIALYTIAKRQSIKRPWLAFIPCMWIFIAGKAMGTLLVKGKPAKNLALIATILFTTCEVLSLAINFLTYFPLVGYYLSGGEVVIMDVIDINGPIVLDGYALYNFNTSILVRPEYAINGIVYPYKDANAMILLINIMAILRDLLSIAVLVFSILIYVGLFRKFMPQHYILLTVLSFLGLFPIMVFIVRKKNPVNYNDYLRSRYYGHGYNPYSGVNQNTGGAQPFNEQKMEQPESPFEEFEEKDKKNDNDNPFNI